jgi:hypothetical protein
MGYDVNVVYEVMIGSTVKWHRLVDGFRFVVDGFG